VQGSRGESVLPCPTAPLLPCCDSIHERMPRRCLGQFQVVVAVLGQVGNERQPVGRRLHEHVNKWETLFQRLVAAHADHTTHDGHGHIRPAGLHRLQALQLVVRLVFRLLAHGARFQDHHVGLLGAGRGLVAELFQFGSHTPGVGVVHLTAGDPEVIGLVHLVYCLRRCACAR